VFLGFLLNFIGC